MSNMKIEENGRWKIWWVETDESGTIIGKGVYHRDYKYAGTAYNMATKVYSRNPNVKFIIKQEYPFSTDCFTCGSAVDMYPIGCASVRRLNYLSIRTREHPYLVTSAICDGCIKRIATFVAEMKCLIPAGKET